MLTLSLLAESANISHELDEESTPLSITYHLSSPDSFYAHLHQICTTKPDAVALARLLPIKAFEKFDDFVPEDLLDEANSQGRLDISGAVLACKTVIDRVVPEF